VVESETFAYYLEQEPYIREILDAYMSSKFKTVLDLIERYSSRHYLDIHLSMHVKELATRIKNNALVLYFKPFASVRLESLAQAFGLPLDETERNIVALIQDGSIKGRVDSHNKVSLSPIGCEFALTVPKILKAKDLDHRAELFSRAIKAGADIQTANRKLLLRLRLCVFPLAPIPFSC
jgi:COP9 signalosome complex subunit 1